jgi:hypothetical protein
LNESELEILDVLAKSKDLDDDIAIDILTEMHELAGLKHMRKLELREVEEQLVEIHNRFRTTLQHAAYIIEIAMNMYRLNKLYSRTLAYFFNIFKEVISGKSVLVRISFNRDLNPTPLSS